MLTCERDRRQTQRMKLSRVAAKRLAAAIAASVFVWLLSVQPTAALVCANEWGGDAFASARQAVGQSDRWDGLIVGTISALEWKDDYWRTPVLVVEPKVVFSGDVRDTTRVEIGGHGPDMSFAKGGTYVLVLHDSSDPASPGWFLHPCGPNMELTDSDQLAELRAIGDSEVTVSEPVITGTPGVVPVSIAVAVVALAGVWLMRRQIAERPLRSMARRGSVSTGRD